MKVLKHILMVLFPFMLAFMLLNYYYTDNSYVSLYAFIDNLPPLYVAETIYKTFDDMQNAAAYFSQIFDGQFELEDVADLFVGYVRVLFYVLKFLFYDPVKVVIECFIWTTKVLYLLASPGDIVLTPFDKELLV